MTPESSEPFRLIEAGISEGGEQGRRFRVEIPAAGLLFAGHFPGQPILPGIAHLAFVERALGTPLAAVRSLRLRRPVVPGERLELLLLPAGGDGWARFEVRRGEETVSSGAVATGRLGPIDSLEPVGETGELPVLLPHAAPARLVRSVVAVAAEGIVCAAEVPRSHPLAAGDRFPSFLGIEAAAQAAAVLEALARREADPGPRVGYLVGVREASFAVPSLPAGRPFRVTARLQGSAPPLSIYEITAGEAVAGTLSTFLAIRGDAIRGG